MNLLAYRVVDILVEEGVRFTGRDHQSCQEVAEDALKQAFAAKEVEPGAVTVLDLRTLYHDGWEELLDQICPGETHDRVNKRFFALVFE